MLIYANGESEYMQVALIKHNGNFIYRWETGQLFLIWEKY